MSYKATIPGLVLFYIFACFNCIIYYLCIVNFSWYLFCLLVVPVKLSLLAKWLARKTPLRKPNRGEGIISIKPRPKRAYDCVGLLHSFVILLHDNLCSPRSYVIHFLLLWHVLKNTNWLTCTYMVCFIIIVVGIGRNWLSFGETYVGLWYLKTYEDPLYTCVVCGGRMVRDLLTCSNSGCLAAECNPGQVLYTHMWLCHQAV